MNRRVFLSMGSLGVFRVGAPPPQTKTRARMHVGTQRGPTNDEMLMYFKRHGVDNICGYPPADGEKGDWSVDVLSRFRERCASHGVSLDMVQFPFMSSSHVDRGQRKGIMLGHEPERQREIDEACEIIRNCRAAGIPAVKYNLSLIGVLRTESTPGRGGTTYSTWRLAEALKEQRPLTRAGRVSADEMWERITHFLERVVPVAEEYRIRIACHPQDPGVPPEGFTGVSRVLGTVDGMKRVIAIHESPYHGLNLCLGTTAEMLQDPAREIKEALLHGPEQIADLPVPVAESPGAVRIGHPERSHLVEYLAPNSVFNSLPRQRSSPHLRPDDRLVTIDRVLHHASLGVA